MQTVPAGAAQLKDLCNVLLAGAPKATTDKLQRLLNAAARFLSGTKKFDRGLSQLMHVNNTIQYNIRWLGLDRMQANNTGSGYA